MSKVSQKAAGVLPRPQVHLVQKKHSKDIAAKKKKEREERAAAAKKAAEEKAKKKAPRNNLMNPGNCSDLIKRSRSVLGILKKYNGVQKTNTKHTNIMNVHFAISNTTKRRY